MVDVLNSRAVQEAIAHEQWKDGLLSEVVESLMRNKTWAEMDAVERRACVRIIVLRAESEDDLREHLTELGVEDFAINWHLSEPGYQIGQEAQMLVKALGGLVAKNGALVMIMTPDEKF